MGSHGLQMDKFDHLQTGVVVHLPSFKEKRRSWLRSTFLLPLGGPFVPFSAFAHTFTRIHECDIWYPLVWLCFLFKLARSQQTFFYKGPASKILSVLGTIVSLLQLPMLPL